ncbi:MAG TPA: hypothetical protein VFY10_15015 [Dehalococcoidia bacterium]|nr:hypothetical protein [Dehalococcoidia bacterium]
MLLVALVLAGLSGATVGRDASKITAYHFKARLSVEQSAVDASVFPNDAPLDTIEGWYEAPDHWAWDVSDSSRPTAGSMWISDGASVWYYDRPTNTYSRVSHATYVAGLPPGFADGPPVLSASILLGPLPYANAERFLAPFGQDAQRTEAVGGIIAGRPARAVIFTRGEDHTTFWLDREHPFILKYLTHNSELSVSAEITSLSLNQPLDDAPLSFEPPPDSREVPQTSSGSSRSSGSGSSGTDDRSSVPDGFLQPGDVPAGYNQTATTETSGMGDRVTYVALLFQPQGQIGAAGDHLLVEEQFRAGGLAPSQQTGTAVLVGSTTGYETMAGDLRRLIFAQGDVVVTLSSNALQFEELIKVASTLS